MKRLILVVAMVMVGCTAPDKSRETLYKMGFTDVEITGYKMFDCSQDDNYSTGFRAKNPNGVPVEGTVCCGVLKGCTVRF